MLSNQQKVCSIIILGTFLNVYITLFINKSFNVIKLSEIKTVALNGADRALCQSTVKEIITENASLSKIVNKNTSGAINLRLSRGERLLQNVRLPLTIHRNVFLTTNPNICKGVEGMLLLVMVHSATENFERRQVFRETWENVELFISYNTRVIFLLGKTKNETTQKRITRENGCYGDIVQGDFIDTYLNLTHKAVLGLRWITENCAHARFVVKVDDDVFVNIFKLVSQIIEPNAYKSRTIFCDSRRNDIIHRSGHRWGVDSHQFSGMKRWPFPYCAGFFVVITADIIPELYEKAKTSEFLWLDDVYVYGLLAHKIGYVTHIDIKKNTNYFEKVVAKCFSSKRERCHLIGGVINSIANMRMFWNILVEHRNMYTNRTIKQYTNKTCHLHLI